MGNPLNPGPLTTGDADAMYRLGSRLYDRGRFNDAEQSFRKAAAAGHADAMHWLGLLLFRHRMAVRIYSWHFFARQYGATAIGSGPDQMNEIAGRLYAKGKYAEASQSWRKAATAGNSHAMYNLAWFLKEMGRSDEGEQWQHKAIAAGEPDAMYREGTKFYEQGQSGYAEAERLWRLAAAAEPADSKYRGSAGTAYTLYSLAAVLHKQGKDDEAKQWLRKAETAGQQQFWGAPGAKKDMWEPRFYFNRSGIHRVPFGWQWNKNLSIGRTWTKKWSSGLEWSKTGGDPDASRWAAEMGEKAAERAEEMRREDEGLGPR